MEEESAKQENEPIQYDRQINQTLQYDPTLLFDPNDNF